MEDRKWGRNRAVIIICYIACLGLLWGGFVGPILNSFGLLPGGFDPDAGLLVPLVGAVLGAGGLRAHEKKNGRPTT